MWDDEVLPSGEADVSGAEFAGEVCDGVGSFAGEAADRDDDADVVVSVSLFIGAYMAVFDFRAFFFTEVLGNETEGEGEFLLDFFEELGCAPVVDEILEACLFSVGAVAVFDEDAKHCGSESCRFAWGG